MQDQRLEWLRPRLDAAFADKLRLEKSGSDPNQRIQSGREYRNPRICEKLIEACNIQQYGTNLDPATFNPDTWRNNRQALYGSRYYQKLAEKRERDKNPDAATNSSSSSTVRHRF